MTFNSKKNACAELGSQRNVFCLECDQVEELGVADFSFDDDFGGVSDYQVVTMNCEGRNWTEAMCDVCGTNGEPEVLRDAKGQIRRDENDMALRSTAQKLVRAPKGSDLRVVCESCFKNLQKELDEEAKS
jgi:hypothetical protein